MLRLKALTDSDADARARELFGGIEKKLGMVPNVMRTMAHSPAVLEAYLALTGALAKGSLSPRLREQIALAVAEANQCEYCLAAHTALGRMAGLKDDEIADSRRASSGDRRAQAVLVFTRELVRSRGLVSDEDVQSLRHAGVTDGEISEIVANVAANILTNYMNHVAGTEIDFPKAESLQPAAACAC